MYNWVKEMGIITEGVVRFPPDSPTIDRSPQGREARSSYRNNKIGLNQPSQGDMSVANGVPFGNPFEQEEEIEEKLISKKEILSKIESLFDELNPRNPQDLVAVATLAELKEYVKNIS